MSFAARAQTIENPYFEAKTTGIYNITKVERTKKETRVHIHSTFIPGWWVQFDDDENIVDPETGKSYQVVGIEGSKFGEKLWMPASGDSTVVLSFPPLPKEVKKFDYNKYIFGVSLDKSLSGKKTKQDVPAEVMDWINGELGQISSTSTTTSDPELFFNEDTARIVGYIKGYDPRLGFSTGIIYMSNHLTREDYPIVLQIHPDGRFEAEMPFSHPQFTKFVINNYWIPFYLEPGQTLGVVLDWEEFLVADRRRNIRYQFKDMVYLGPLAKINTELAEFDQEQFDYNEFMKKVATLSPEAYKQDQMLTHQSNLKRLEEYASEKALSEEAKNILTNHILLENGTHLFDFIMRREYEARNDTTNEILQLPVPNEYYDFLKDIPLNDQRIIVPNEFSVFVNRFEYCQPFNQSFRSHSIRFSDLKPEMDFITYLEEDNISLPEEEKQLYLLINKSDHSEEESALLAEHSEDVKNFHEKYDEQFQAYFQEYLRPLIEEIRSETDPWKVKDSILVNRLGINPNLVYEITKIRSLDHQISNMTKDNAPKFWDKMNDGITHPYLIKTGEYLLAKNFPEEEIVAFELPSGKATDIFKKIIEPYKGKILFVDFWATSCGPCISGIKQMKETREKYKDNPDFDFIFITEDGASPEGKYNEFVQDQDLSNTYRISKDDYNYLRQLFKFNGIPRYVVIDKDGKVMDDNFSMYSFEHELPKILAKK